ncbi:CLUMA_CG016231, isoform A [Clunio marinus]|uniref:CLUMA_CG016231, isoform A n=1 Tax=Clunio marinus TaxID=568069 RepID=A0A1J1IYE9_9DIPT|nr:CLUMA_CG016231, isoform A [Clunio marinus]
MISSFKLLLIIISVAITPTLCGTCRFFLNRNFNYGCEMYDVNVTERNQNFVIGGEHLPGFSHADVRWLNFTNPGTLNFIPLTIFQSFVSMREAIIVEVEVKEIQRETFGGCNNLERINLDRNLIQEISSMTFGGCFSLTEISLSRNAIETIENYAFSGPRALRTLSLSNNLISTLPENAFANLTTLNRITLENNRITQLPENIFSTLTSLNSLNLHYNLLVSLPPRLFAGPRLLFSISISNNRLESLNLGADSDPPVELPWLWGVFASNNNISRIHPFAFNRNSSTHKLEVIDLSHNNLKEFAPGTFHGLYSLRTLNLNHNQISSLPNDTFSNCAFEVCRGALGLELSNNELEIIHSELFVEAPHIDRLDLTSNRISAIDRNTFSVLRSLRTILLAGNLCSEENFYSINVSNMPRVLESLGECFLNYDKLTGNLPGGSPYHKTSFVTVLITAVVSVSSFLSFF